MQPQPPNSKTPTNLQTGCATPAKLLASTLLLSTLLPAQPYLRRARTSAISAASAVLCFVALWLSLPQHLPAATAQSSPAQSLPDQTVNEATVIVQFDDQARIVRGIEFSTPVSGLAALQQSGLDVVYTDTSFGPAVCAIEAVGCPASDCFCSDNYWGYNYWDGQGWQGYAVGPGTSSISQTGWIEGWRWGAFGDASVSVSPTLAAASALEWLHGRQVITNGGYGSAGASIEVLLAVGANHIAASEWRQTPDSPSLASYMTHNAAAYTKAAAGAAGKSAVAMSAAEVCLPVGALTPNAHFSPTLGAYSDQSGANSWAILGAVAIDENVPAAAVDALRASALADGGWEWMPGWGSDTNSTALAIQALLAAGDSVSSTHVLNGLAYLATAQNTDGGFAYAAGSGEGSDANSTAYVVQAIIASQQEPEGAAWTINNNTPVSYLLAMQLADGTFEWQAGTGSNHLATMQVIPALLGQAYPAALRELAHCPATYMPSVSKP